MTNMKNENGVFSTVLDKTKGEAVVIRGKLSYKLEETEIYFRNLLSICFFSFHFLISPIRNNTVKK